MLNNQNPKLTHMQGLQADSESQNFQTPRQSPFVDLMFKLNLIRSAASKIRSCSFANSEAKTQASFESQFTPKTFGMTPMTFDMIPLTPKALDFKKMLSAQPAKPSVLDAFSDRNRTKGLGL